MSGLLSTPGGWPCGLPSLLRAWWVGSNGTSCFVSPRWSIHGPATQSLVGARHPLRRGQQSAHGAFLTLEHDCRDAGGRAMQEQLPTTAGMQEVEQCRSNCRGKRDSGRRHGWRSQTKLDAVERSRLPPQAGAGKRDSFIFVKMPRFGGISQTVRAGRQDSEQACSTSNLFAMTFRGLEDLSNE